MMQAVQSSFISSTFWTERIGPTAALKTIELMEDEKSWLTVTSMGKNIQNQWHELATAHDLKIEIKGIPALSNFSFLSPNKLKYKTLISQEMLKLGYLASTNCYVCTCHTSEIVNRYLECLESVFRLISGCENDKYNIDTLLEGPVCHDGLKKLN